MNITTDLAIHRTKMDKCKTILIIGLCLLALAYFWWYEPCEEADYEGYSQQIETLKQQNDLLKADNLKLDVQVSRLKSEADSIMKLVRVDRKVINELKKSEHERITAINDFDNDELFRFFSGIKTDSTANK